jgi:tRNA threonylcarbamoyladenosine biosynthesis protein TsaB
MALATGKQVAGFSSLAMLAMNLPWAAYPVCPMFDARKHEVYTAVYRCRDLPEPVIADSVAPPDKFIERVTGSAIFVGEGAVRYRDVITSRLGDRALFAPLSINMPRASAGALLVRDAFAKGSIIPLASLAPGYVRPSEAELANICRQNQG